MTDPRNRVRCAHMEITSDAISAYCSLCVSETMHALGCDEVTAKHALALHHGFNLGDGRAYRIEKRWAQLRRLAAEVNRG